MDISPIQFNGYTLSGDVTKPGQASLADDDIIGNKDRDSVSISEAAKEFAKQIAEARDKAAAEKSAEERYADALAFGPDYMTSLEKGVQMGATIEDRADMFKTDAIPNCWIAGPNRSASSTTVTEKGTVIGISSIEAVNTFSGEMKPYNLQITRKDGLQLNLDLSEDIRVNDLEDGGLAVHYAQSGLTRIFGADGSETQTREEGGELKGTVGKDVLINKHSASVDAGDGDDIIINLRDNTKITAGDGNDKIINMGYTRNVDINSGSGDNAIYSRAQGGSLDLTQGSNKVFMDQFSGNISLGDESNALTVNSLFGKLSIGNGALSAEIDSIFRVNLAHAEGATGQATIKSRSIYDSTIDLRGHNNGVPTSGNTLTADTIDFSKVYTGEGDDRVDVRSLHVSTLDTGAGNDTVSVTTMGLGKLDTGDGDDLVYSKSSFGTIDGGAGDDVIYTPLAYGTSVGGGTGNNTIYRVPLEKWDAFMKNPSAFTPGKEWVESYSGSRTQNYSFYDKFLYDLVDAKGIPTPWNQDSK